MCISFQIDPLKTITDTWTGLSRPIGYLRDPEPRISRLTDAMNLLRYKSMDLRDEISSAELAGKKPTHQVQEWLAKVAAIEAEVWKIQTDHYNGAFRWCINRRGKHILDNVTALLKDSVFDVVATNLLPNRVQEVPAGPPVVTLSMGYYLSQLHAFLQADGSRIIGIWGMGGVGKTTLLKSLNNELLRALEAGQNPPMFDHVIWAVVSKEYQLGKLQRDIAKRIGLPLSGGDDELQQATDILNFLRNKNFLVLLDDLWQAVDLAELGIPQLLGAGARKQKVVFTTRLKGVCREMQAGHMIKLECLSEEEAWQLFRAKVGQETLQAHKIIESLAQRVAIACDGLPLALVVIGTAMSKNKEPKLWQNAITQLEKSRSYEILGLNDKILPKLKFSYDKLLAESIKKCFLLCSSWPEGHSFLKTDLIECWMGHGLVDIGNFDNINEAYDNGHAVIADLQAACLLEPGNDGDREVKMHDVVRDLALWISSDCGEKPDKFIALSGVIASKDSQREVERISLVRSDDILDTSGLPPNIAKLETLMVLESYPFSSIVTGFFEGTPALIYLDLSNTTISNLPPEIGLLRNLRYINLSHTNIQSLPGQVGDLHELRFLLLRELKSVDIPCGVLKKLVMLSVIDMTGTLCKNWQELSELRGPLKGVGIVLESIEDLRELARMPNVLTWRLGLMSLEKSSEPLQLLSSSHLGSSSIRSSIQMLKIEYCDYLRCVWMDSVGDSCSTKKWCLSRLEELELRKLPELEEIFWIRVSAAEMLPSLTVLTICDCHKLSNISWVKRLPSLEDLSVLRCSEMKQIIDDDVNEIREVGEEDNGVGSADWAFPSLRRLCLRNLSSLEVFGIGSLTFPSLEVLQVIQCPKMKTLPFKAEMAGSKLKEIWGDRKWWVELEMEDIVRAALLPRFKPVVDSVAIA